MNIESDNMSLPVLDVSTFIRADANKQKQFQQDLLQSLQSHGFVKLINHGFGPRYVDELMEWVGANMLHSELRHLPSS